MALLSVTFPLFCFLIGGMCLRRFARLSEDVIDALSKLTYYVGMPALIFRNIASFDFQSTFRPDMVAHNLLTATILFVLLFGAAFLVKPKTLRGAFHLSGFRANIGYIGLPVVNGFYGEQALSRAAVINGFESPYCVVLSILSLSVFRALQGTPQTGEKSGKLLLKNLIAFLYNPFLIATLLGLVCAYYRLPVATAPVLSELLAMTSAIALPLALLSIGASIRPAALKKGKAALISICAVRLMIAPAIGYVLGRFVFGFAGTDLAMTTLLCGTPVSVSSFVLASELSADKEFSAAAIGVSTLLSLVSLSALQTILTV